MQWLTHHIVRQVITSHLSAVATAFEMEDYKKALDSILKHYIMTNYQHICLINILSKVIMVKCLTFFINYSYTFKRISIYGINEKLHSQSLCAARETGTVIHMRGHSNV